jgi:nucleotide-binding universal stress UspA family protein
VDSRIGTVCERVVRRADIDTLVIKSPTQSISAGPIVAAIDGSAQSYGALLSALSLAQDWQLPLHVVSAFDPYYHYVAFNRIAGVLSEEAGKVFRFQEQEKLHEEIIDSGLAKIYAGHLKIAEDIAADYGIRIETTLLDGKPHDVIVRFLRDLQPSLLAIGKLGIQSTRIPATGRTHRRRHDILDARGAGSAATRTELCAKHGAHGDTALRPGTRAHCHHRKHRR